MTRIIAGAAARVKLRVPDKGTRPTSDRVREALFSTLEARDAIIGSGVLDLYAGSGALGLEALSRGASAVVLVEKAQPAARLCRLNAEAVRTAVKKTTKEEAGPVTVTQSDVASYLTAADTTPIRRFGLVFYDPPYEMGEEQVHTDLTLLTPLLDSQAIVVVERSRRSPAPDWPEAYSPEKPRNYGETALYLASLSADLPGELRGFRRS